MCYGMHCVGAAVIAAKATPEQENRYLRPIVDSGHVTTLALSEKGTGVHFYLPQTSVEREADAFVVQGVKQFVTNGGHADSYVVSVRAPATRTHPGEFSCLMIDRDADGVSWRDPWRGFGMRGTASTAMAIDRARVPLDRLLGEEGDQIWFVFEVVAPYFLVAMSGTYLGVAQAALNQVLAHLRTRRYQHSGETLAEVSVVQHRLARIWTEVERTRLLIREAARLGDRGEPSAMTSLIAAKAAAGDTAVLVANEAMTLCGGTAYRENGALAQALRDARAGHVMSPTTDLLREWLAKSLLGMPLL
jgi:alkylation response protein AidB-like acyl-CoA dehydrogenase